jgi:hypothetical protein
MHGVHSRLESSGQYALARLGALGWFPDWCSRGGLRDCDFPDGGSQRHSGDGFGEQTIAADGAEFATVRRGTGDHNHRDLPRGWMAPHMTTELPPIEARHVEIRDQDIGREHVQPDQSVFPVAGFLNHEAFADQCSRESMAGEVVIIHEQHSQRAEGLRRSMPRSYRGTISGSDGRGRRVTRAIVNNALIWRG